MAGGGRVGAGSGRVEVVKKRRGKKRKLAGGCKGKKEGGDNDVTRGQDLGQK